MRSKEDAQDYRYFPEPDLTPIVISDEYLEKIKSAQPEMQPQKIERYVSQYGIPKYDASIITGTKRMADFFEEVTAINNKPKKAANWLMTETLRLQKEKSMDADEIPFSAKNLASLIDLADEGTVNNTVAKEIFEKIFEEDVDPVSYVEEHGLKSVSDEGELSAILDEVIANNPQAVEDYRGGKKKAIGALVGQVMKATGGKANPAVINKLLMEKLN